MRRRWLAESLFRRNSQLATGDITFPGILYPRRLVASRTPGVEPNCALLWAHTQSTAPSLYGTLTFGFNGIGIIWGDAMVDLSAVQVSTSGQWQMFKIYDRRHRWRNHVITGAYNVVLPDGTVDPDTTKSLTELVQILFSAMGESSPDLSAITSSERPMVVWDRDVAADELDELLSVRGYAVHLANNGTPVVHQIGSGTVLSPDSETVSLDMQIDPPEKPEYLGIVCDHTRVQSKLKCRPVGREVSGEWKHADSVSYAPAGGWNNSVIKQMNWITDPATKAIAEATIGKCYQVDTQADGSHDIAAGSVDYAQGEIAITTGFQYLPVSADLVESLDGGFGKVEKKKAFVEALYFEGGEPTKQAQSDGIQIIEDGYTLDEDLGIVTFDEPLLRKDDSGDMTSDTVFADVYLTTSYVVTDPSTHVRDRYVRTRNLGGYGDVAIKVKELARTLVCHYGSDNITITSIDDNQTTIQAEADYLLDTAQNRYVTTLGKTLVQRGIQNINTDGITQQVMWYAADNGHPVPFRTVASQGMESIPFISRHTERYRRRAVRRNDDVSNRRKGRYLKKRD